jgi:hypothetical protein
MRGDLHAQVACAEHGREGCQCLRPAIFRHGKAHGAGRQIFQKIGLQDKYQASVDRPVEIELLSHQNLRNCDSGTPFSSIHLL